MDAATELGLTWGFAGEERTTSPVTDRVGPWLPYADRVLELSAGGLVARLGAHRFPSSQSLLNAFSSGGPSFTFPPETAPPLTLFTYGLHHPLPSSEELTVV